MPVRETGRTVSTGAVAAAMWLCAGAASALSAPDEFEFALSPQATPSDYSLVLVLKRSFADVLGISALIEPSWVDAAHVGDVVKTVSPSSAFSGALFTGTPDNPAYELAYFDENGLVLGGVTASAASPVTVFTWGLHIASPPAGSTIGAKVNVEMLDPATFESTLLSGTQVLAVPVPEPSTWMLFAAGLVAVGGLARRRLARRPIRDRSVVVDL